MADHETLELPAPGGSLRVSMKGGEKNMTNLLNTKILLSGATILAAAALVIGATFAFFSDSETSTGNTFAAGDLDLRLGPSADRADGALELGLRHVVEHLGNRRLVFVCHDLPSTCLRVETCTDGR